MDNTNEKENLEWMVKVDAINEIEELKKFYKKNEVLGVKFAKYVNKRKEQIEIQK